MFTIALISEASAGKTTLAIALAVAAERDGLPTMLVDLDPGGSIMAWSGLRRADAVNAVPLHAPMCCSAPPGRLQPVLKVASAPSVGARIAVIDTASGADAAALDAATRAAHLVLVPCRPADVTAIGRSTDLARHAGTPTVVVLNDVPSPAPSRVHHGLPSPEGDRGTRHRLLARRHAPPARTMRSAWTSGRTAQELSSQTPGSPGD